MAICEKYKVNHSAFLDWPEEDQDLAIAQHLRELDHCPRCHTSESKWQKNRFAYKPEVRRCRGCEMRQLQEDDLQTQKGTAGMFVVMVPDEG